MTNLLLRLFVKDYADCGSSRVRSAMGVLSGAVGICCNLLLFLGKLIVGTQEKISVIAGMVGYVQLNNFYIHFRNYFGVSPSALRNFETAAEPAEV